MISLPCSSSAGLWTRLRSAVVKAFPSGFPLCPGFHAVGGALRLGIKTNPESTKHAGKRNISFLYKFFLCGAFFATLFSVWPHVLFPYAEDLFRGLFWSQQFVWHYRFLAVLADCLKALAVGAPLLPGLRIRSPEPAFMRLRLAWMFA